MSFESEQSLQRPEHGGNIRDYASRLGVPESDILDLSTGISPLAYPLSPVPLEHLQRMPYCSPSLLEVAANYYGVKAEQCLPVAGSQQAIQALPGLLPTGNVLLPATGYAEHRYCWLRAGHREVLYQQAERRHIADRIRGQQVQSLVLIHPNNPTGHYIGHEDVLYWHSLLPRDGLLVIDEAFIDATPTLSMSELLPLPGLVILRSIGKFFGLPGLRLGFVLAQAEWLQRLQEALGPWSVNAMAQWGGEQLLADRDWQERAREHLNSSASALQELIAPLLATRSTLLSSTPLFFSSRFAREEAMAIHQGLLQQRILVRHYTSESQEDWLRFGLVSGGEQRKRLQLALEATLAGLEATCPAYG